MRVYGLDFTSNPTPRKRLTLAVCELSQKRLIVERLVELRSNKKGDFTSFENWITGTGEWSGEKQWIAGIDFPFGMPVEAIEHFGWLANSTEQTWTSCLTELFKSNLDLQLFRELVEGWRHSSKQNKKGELVRVRKLRLTDKLAVSGSPMNFFPPPVCPMFFQGAQRLRLCPSDVSVFPVRILESATKWIVESYPRLVANVFIGRKDSYKNKSKKKSSDKNTQLSVRREDEDEKRTRRVAIVDGLCSEKLVERYGFRLEISAALSAECTTDNDGDKIDSVMSAVQAGWAHTAEHRGMPAVTLTPLAEQIRLEGWIVDPFVLRRFSDGDS